MLGLIAALIVSRMHIGQMSGAGNSASDTTGITEAQDVDYLAYCKTKAARTVFKEGHKDTSWKD